LFYQYNNSQAKIVKNILNATYCHLELPAELMV